MANVKICDRCGEKLITKCIVSLRPVRYILRRETSRLFIGEHYNDISEKDLCKNCAAELDEFMKGKANTNEPD
jgi:hypothetical protein